MRGQNENFSRNRCLIRKKENSIRIYDNNLHLREDHKEFLKKKKKKKKVRVLFLENLIVRNLI